MQLAVRRDFTNPMVKKIFEMIGSWDFQHDKEKDLLAKVQDARQKYLRTSENLIEESTGTHQNLVKINDLNKSTA
jgi:hypothetical protein